MESEQENKEQIVKELFSPTQSESEPARGWANVFATAVITVIVWWSVLSIWFLPFVLWYFTEKKLFLVLYFFAIPIGLMLFAALRRMIACYQ